MAGHDENVPKPTQEQDPSDESQTQGRMNGSTYESMTHTNRGLTRQERRQMRQKNQAKKDGEEVTGRNLVPSTEISDGRFAERLAKNEDELLNFVAQVNNVYQEKLKKNAPFMTFVLCGMQSAGKSTLVERFMHDVLNIIQEGTGTRCPLDVTCIHDDSCVQPKCDLRGDELAQGMGGSALSVKEVFDQITQHNRRLAEEDRFGTATLRLVYRSKRVQNMRFVDTPGIISNKSTGKDNRDEIKTILQSEMRKENTKLCVLLEPKEFVTNPIVDFCDESFGHRSKWISDTIFIMTKFDKQLEDSRTASKANAFFREFKDNFCLPHLVITPTLPKEDLPTQDLFEARRKLLDSADQLEKDRFANWLTGHEKFREENPGDDERLGKEFDNRIGFRTAVAAMRKIMLEDTAKRLPEVLRSLRKDLTSCLKEQKILQEKEKFNDPQTLKHVVMQILWHMEKRILSYLDGDLEAAMKFPERLQTLEEEIEEEEDSEWSSRELNHFTETENNWRDLIAQLEGNYAAYVKADKKLLGGKQVHRAICFFNAVMIEALPDPFQLREMVPNVTGYLSGGLHRENWERAMVQITKVCVKDTSHPGINYLIKHVGSIFRRLFTLALDDVKQGEEFSATFKLLPRSVEKHLIGEFDDMLWDLLQSVAEQTHCSLEPMYSTVDPDLPTFHPSKLTGTRDGNEDDEGWMGTFKRRMTALLSSSGDQAKEFLRNESVTRATSKKGFLPDERASMITDEESVMIVQRSFEYIVALTEFNMFTLKFSLNHYLYEGFKTELSKSFHSKLIGDADWEKLVEPDPDVRLRLDELKGQIAGLKDSLDEVQRMQRRL